MIRMTTSHTCSAEGYNLQQTQNDEITRSKEDVLVIDQESERTGLQAGTLL